MEPKTSSKVEVAGKKIKLDIRKLKFTKQFKEKNNRFYSDLGQFLNECYFIFESTYYSSDFKRSLPSKEEWFLFVKKIRNEYKDSKS